MMEHPEVLEKAQTEVDTVVGADRLPTLEDRQGLPYGTSVAYQLTPSEVDVILVLVEGIFQELLRWSVALPLGNEFRCFLVNEIL